MDILDSVNFYSPLLLWLLFVIPAIRHACTYRQGTGVYPKSPRVALCTSLLSWIITTSFALLFILRISVYHEARRSTISHAISATLLWITLSLVYQISSQPSWLAFCITWMATGLLEAFLSAVPHILHDRIASSSTLSFDEYLQMAIAMQCFALSILGISTSRKSGNFASSPEEEPLLSDSSSHSSADSTCSGSGSETLANDSDDDDEKQIALQRDQKLREAGGWIGYLGTFAVFVPHVLPNSTRHRLYAIFIFVNIVLERITNVLQPLQVGIIIDHVSRTGQIPWPNVTLWVVLGFLSSHAVGLTAIKNVTQYRLTEWAKQRIKVAAFTKIMNLSMAFHDEKESGEIIKAVEQASSLSELFCALVEDILPGIFDLCVAIWYVSHLLDFYAVHIVVAMVIGFTFTTLHMIKYTSVARRQVGISERNESKMVYETIENWSTVSYFERKKYEIGRLAEVTSRYAIAEIRDNDWLSALWGFQEAWELVAHYAIAMVALYRVSIGTSSIGTFVSFESYWDTISEPLYNMGYTYRHIAADMINAERLIQLFETEPTVKEEPQAIPLRVSKGQVRFEDVSFTYKDSKTILHDLNFTAEGGTTTAFVGETGSGKSSIFKLLMRFFDIDSGTIIIDEQDIAKTTLSSLRSAFGIVPQDSVLFNTTILENVRYGRLDATDFEVYDACRAAQIHDKILTFPHGYASRCGERGVKLSGGERQRIAIARVLLKRPEIILLDEATSAMDTNVEGAIQQSLKALMKGRTAFVIAHRLSTISEADQILVMDAGRIVERGTHGELLKLGGRYAKMWNKQSAAVEEAEEITSDASAGI